MQIPLLQEVVIILGLSVIVIFVFQKLKIPTILGFLLTGAVAGPYGLKLINASHEVEVLSEIGVIMLLFIIGLEFSLKTLVAIGNIILIGGAVQVGGTILLTWGSMQFFGFSSMEALFLGFLLSLSSTAIVLKALQERNEVSTPHGKIALAVLIFQDIVVVPMMLLTPILAGQSGNIWEALLGLVLKAGLVIVAVFISARYLVPRALYEIAKTRSQELFILSIVVICFAVAWVTSTIGLSLALGAFMAGLIISESDYSYQATGIIIPFREIFSSFFFVSIGMLLDLHFLWQHLWLILLLTLLVALGKFLVAGLAALVLKYPIRTVLLTGITLFQVGEFAFILSDTGLEYGLFQEDAYQYFLSISILTMGATPFLVNASPWITRKLVKTPIPVSIATFNKRLFNAQEENREDFLKDLKDHIIIIGFGITGRNVAKAARFAGIPYVILETNAATVRQEQAKGEPIYFGDATNHFVLEHVKVWSARVAIVAISDPGGTRSVVMNIRSICPTVYIIIRTRYVRDVDELLRLGANEIVPEEFESSVEIFTRLLHCYLVPQDEIEEFVRDIRADSYQMLRPAGWPSEQQKQDLSIPNFNVTCLRVQHGKNEVVGQPLSESNVRARYGINLLAIQRDGKFITDIEGDTKILQEDLLYVIGTPEAVADFNVKVKY